MKVFLNRARQKCGGNVLLLVLILLGVSLVMVSGMFSYSTSNVKQNARNNDYYLALGAAEAATEKVLAQIVTDYRAYGDGYVVRHLDSYRTMVPKGAESPEWRKLELM